ncbi:MAG TPA: tRNA (N6-threonylcarbamoyladenosine(37)-N6)-methyltransferase TrmO [Dehalococcoidia bacterium]|jgi:tRNA-Thr(GGU) m(6)t(6)A37 methyltransferase TsaA|nr:tRNA (N6-threonylcarbamoyladenosine(37)-N6)-methyltransferase TrmO [Dehalococcoidia bacterium]
MLRRIRGAFKRSPEPFPGLPDVTITPIGYVRNKVKETMPDGWDAVDSDVVLRPELEPMLLNLGEYSHVIVVFWPHKVPDEVRGSKPQLHPRDDEQYPLMGVLATRSQIRPNPVLTSPVRLLSVKGNVLRVRGLDAIDGTPVLDIKPYLPHYDSVPDARVPDWVAKAQAWRKR